MTWTKEEAYEAMLEHHEQLREEVVRRAEAIRRAVRLGSPFVAAAAELVAYVGDEVLPHALAEEQTIYPAAAALPALAANVAEMVAEHSRIVAAVEKVAAAASGDAAASAAAEIAELFSNHVSKENELLLPPLVRDDAVDLAALLSEMQQLTASPKAERSSTGDPAPDPASSLLSLLLGEAERLGRAGREGRACELAAAAWKAVRASRSDLAARVTAVLHRLARLATDEPVMLVDIAAAPAAADGELDVRALDDRCSHEEASLGRRARG